MVDPAAHLTVYHIASHQVEVPLLVDLMSREQSLRAAIRLAQRLDAYLLIN
jgi:hypothetical protein